MKWKYAVFVADKDDKNLWITYGTLPDRTFLHLDGNPPHVEHDTHLAKFYRSNKERESDMLTNHMPGSSFTNYEFERHTFGTNEDAVDVIVGWYW